MTAAAPQPTEEDRLAAIRAAIDAAHRFGITSVQDAGGTADDLELLARLRKRGELTLRVYQALRADATLTAAGLDELDQVRTRFADDPLLKTGAVKLIADGVIESHTAAMLHNSKESAYPSFVPNLSMSLPAKIIPTAYANWKAMVILA